MIPTDVFPPRPINTLTPIRIIKLDSGEYHHQTAALAMESNELLRMAESIALLVNSSLDRSSAASPASPPSRKVTPKTFKGSQMDYRED